MAQYRQQYHYGNGTTSDHVAIGVRGGGGGGGAGNKAARWRRSGRGDKNRRISIGFLIVVLSLVLVVTVLVYYYISADNNDNSEELNSYHPKDVDSKVDSDFLTNVTRMDSSKVLSFGRSSIAHGRDSRYWDRDDRRRDDDYNEDVVEHNIMDSSDESLDGGHVPVKVKNEKKEASLDPNKDLDRRAVGLYNEAGRNELKRYEKEYELSLKDGGKLQKELENSRRLSDSKDFGLHDEVDADDHYNDGFDSSDSQTEDYDDFGHDKEDNVDEAKSHDEHVKEFSTFSKTKERHVVKEGKEESMLSREASGDFGDVDANSQHVGSLGRKGAKSSRADSKRKPRRRKFSGSCEMKLLNSTHLVEPLESRKFARFSLQYKQMEENSEGEEQWVPTFAGHQSLQEREESFLAHDQKINCGFVKGPQGYPSTGFDLAEDDVNYISRCHIAVISCIFGNSDRLRTPAGKMVTRLSRKNVCFVMFVDEVTMQTLFSEGQSPDGGFIGLWKIVVVKNLPYADMRRVGKIPKLLPHRLFPSARYSIWLDSKLRLQRDPLQLLDYFLWRKGHEYAISNHYDRHCVWEEVAQNKKLNKYNHTVIDEQFEFYQADGLKKFNSSDPNKLLPSNVPEGSFIVRAHTPMSNLFSCLWFNEVERFTPRDQLSFAYTYQKLRRMNPDKPFYLNMFKDCERRAIAKLFRHRSEEKRNVQQQAML
ncbi:Alkaline ceramidase TOD1/Probable hexosyltransferase MUCI70 - like 7 [Theobroma cacao]|uniref:Uncharacterized protein isoform 2 n=2 Tax=Theobroma cacao TaxID=3641 RepID=A0A061FJZ2_THECC|nr:Uncharacterized protein TCM_036343 isoform 2 [Theobroma cacao]EOY17188.1 Uncharacterized protein TCM_036343 isoform 2 [Theobroma cacao]WRX31028.1 Alkaline ceramidase TOD1/Probable hexosyltransferase MUCI70 - like 7 [Theobroma cacao]